MHQYVNAFEAYGVELVPTDAGLYRIAQKAFEEHTGARSLVGVCERTFREYKYNLPHSSAKRLDLTARLVTSRTQFSKRSCSRRSKQLKEMDQAFAMIAEEWSKQNGSRSSSYGAARLLSQKALESGDSLVDVFSEIFKDYEHGLNLIEGLRVCISSRLLLM